MNFDISVYSNPGGRSCNQDRAAGWTQGSAGLFVLADGLGGHESGEVAAQCVLDTLEAAWKRSPQALDADGLEAAVLEANRTLLARQEAESKKMKSTVVALSIREDCPQWVHVGDSRLYRLSHGALTQLTEDHGVSYQKYRAGEITKAQINTDEDRSSLLRAVGDLRRCIPQSGGDPAPLAPGTGFLLCSDGFWEYLTDEEILVDGLKAADAQDWLRLLLLRIMERLEPGTDNLSAIALFLQEGGSQ